MESARVPRPLLVTKANLQSKDDKQSGYKRGLALLHPRRKDSERMIMCGRIRRMSGHEGSEFTNAARSDGCALTFHRKCIL